MPAQENRWNEEETSNVCSLDRHPHVAASRVRQAGMGCPSLISHGERGCRGCCKEQLADSLWASMLCPLPLFYPGTPPPAMTEPWGLGGPGRFCPTQDPSQAILALRLPVGAWYRHFQICSSVRGFPCPPLLLSTSVPSSALPLMHVSPAALQSEGFPCCLASF